MWRIKPLEQIISHAGHKPLKRSLGAFDLTLLGVGVMVGAGIFVLTGVAASKAGPAVGIAFAIAGIVSLLAALAYAEVAAMIPVTGGAYTFAYASMGEVIAWLVGWNLLLEFAVGAAAVASGWSGYVVGLLAQTGVYIPAHYSLPPRLGGLVDGPAILITLAITGLLTLGTRRSALVNSLLVIVKLSVLGLFLWLAIPAITKSNWQPLLALGWFERISGGETVGVLAASAIVFFSYAGVQTLASAAEEARNPSRDLPLSLIFATLICIVLFVSVGFASTGVVRWFELSLSKEPLALVLRTAEHPVAAGVVAVGALAGLTALLLSLLYGVTRIAFVMARDKLLPEPFARLHGQHQTPHIVTGVAGAVIALIAGFVPLDKIVELSNIGTLFAFASVCAAALVLRLTHKETPRPFRCPGLWIIAPVAFMGCAALMALLPYDTWIRFLGWSLAGIVVYAAYGFQKSPYRQVSAS